jgi:hypothetical protein
MAPEQLAPNVGTGLFQVKENRGGERNVDDFFSAALISPYGLS